MVWTSWIRNLWGFFPEKYLQKSQLPLPGHLTSVSCYMEHGSPYVVLIFTEWLVEIKWDRQGTLPEGRDFLSFVNFCTGAEKIGCHEGTKLTSQLLSAHSFLFFQEIWTSRVSPVERATFHSCCRKWCWFKPGFSTMNAEDMDASRNPLTNLSSSKWEKSGLCSNHLSFPNDLYILSLNYLVCTLLYLLFYNHKEIHCLLKFLYP